MSKPQPVNFYPPLEEKVNIASHAIGLLLSVFALAFMVTRASLHGNAWHIVSASLFGASMIALYAASTWYHSTRDPQLRARLRIVDHAAIYVLIAGTYTPFVLVTLRGAVGWVIFGISWGMALAGITLKLFFTGKFNLLSTLMYVFMGWIIIFAVKPLINNLPPEGLFWVIAGGIAYTLGAIIYSIRKIPFNHAMFHVLVVVGSACHFLAVYSYVLPDR